MIQRLARLVVERETASFRDMVRTAGIDPARDFVGSDLSNLDFRDEDLRGFNFTGADLSGCDFRRADISGARFEGTKRSGAIGLPDLEPRTAGALVRYVTVRSRSGLTAQATSKLAKLISEQEAKITVAKPDLNGGWITVVGESIMGLLMMTAHQGARLRVEALGPDAESALDLIVNFFEERFRRIR